MTAPPIPMQYEGGGLFRALRRAVGVAEHHYGAGEVILMAPVEERSEVSHRHEFAWLRAAWASLPEHLADEYPSAEALRKRALIATGWCDVRDYACANRAEAQRLAATLRGELDDYTVVIVREAVVRVCRAKSQAKNKMKAADFQASKTAILEWIAGLLEVQPAALERAHAA
jgi:hypothetical protein